MSDCVDMNDCLELALLDFYSKALPNERFERQLGADLQNLHHRLTAARPSEGRSSINIKVKLWFRAQPALAVLVTMLAIVVITGSAYAIGRLAGFIPGFGFVADTAHVSLLADPVSLTQSDVNVRIEKAVGDSERLWVELSVSNLPQDHLFAQAFLKFPDDHLVAFTTGGTTGIKNGQMSMAFNFPAVSEDTTHLRLIIEGLGHQDFELPFELRIASDDEIMPAEPQLPEQLRSETHGGVTLFLDHVTVESDKTIFQVSIQFNQPDVSLVGDWNVTLADSQGRPLPAIDITPAVYKNDAKLFSTIAFPEGEKVRMTLTIFPGGTSLPLVANYWPDRIAGFSFDPLRQRDPQGGWQLDEELKVGNHSLRAVRASFQAHQGLTVEFEHSPDVTGVMLFADEPSAKGARGGQADPSGIVSSTIAFDQLPDEPFDIYVTMVYYAVNGDLSINWMPPAAPQASMPTEAIQSPVALTQVPTASDPLQIADPALAAFFELGLQYDREIRDGTGWVHLVTERESEPTSNLNYPPAYLLSEQWFEIDKDGYVLASTWQDMDAGGNVLQTAATKGTYSVNLTTGDAMALGETLHLLSVMQYSPSQIAEPDEMATYTVVDTVCEDGVACLLMSTDRRFSEPVKIGTDQQLYSGAGSRAWIRQDSGAPIRLETYLVDQNDQEARLASWQVINLEKLSEAPQEILHLLDQVTMP